MAQRKPFKPKRILRKLVISAVSLVFLLLLGEVLARAVEPGPFSFFDENPYMDHPEQPSVHIHRANFEGRWDGTWYEINSLGLRGPELGLTFAPTEFRVAALGDSCTFGKGVLEAHCWPRQLERLLTNELGSDWRAVVANLGVNGYSGATYARYFKEMGDQIRPQVVVVGYNLNDFPNTIRAVDELVFKQRASRQLLSPGLRDFLGRFAGYRWLRQTYYHLKREEDWRNAEAFARAAAKDPIDSAVWEEQKEHLASIKRKARELEAHVAVFLFPYESQVYLDAYDPTPIQQLRAVCEELDLPFVDLAEEFRRAARAGDERHELFLRGDRYHPNAEGYHIVARQVLALMREREWLPAEALRRPKGD